MPCLLGIIFLSNGAVFSLDSPGLPGNSIAQTYKQDQPSSRLPIPDDLNAVMVRDGTAEFFVKFKEQADVSGAHILKPKLEKGQYVFDQLTKIAERTQKDLRAWLKARGVKFQPFWIQNMILITGDQEILNAIVSRSDIASVRLNHTFQVIDPNERKNAYYAPGTRVAEWNLVQINADDVWNLLGITGTGIVVLDADTGALLKSFDTDRAVIGDIIVIPDSSTGLAKWAYAADLGNNIYRLSDATANAAFT